MVRIPGSKTAVPAVPAGLVPRGALRSALDTSHARLIVVVAPAGYGKTLLLADWVRHGATPAAWVSLDRDDTAPRLLSAVRAALRSVLPRGMPVRAATAPGTHRDQVDALAETLEMVDPPVRLVVDDVHEPTSPDALGVLARLIRRRPAGLRLVLAGRADPPLGLARLHLEDELLELRVDRLRFSLSETDALLRDAGVVLQPGQVALLHRRTEGWAAGLRLAASALLRADDVDAFLAEFSGDERTVADYLTGEILPAVPAGLREILRAVSVCSRPSAGLAVALSGRPDAAHLLEGFRRDTALVERTAPDEYRIHTLLRSHLAADLSRHRPVLRRRLEAVAARWWADAGDPVHALRHAERAGDAALVADLLRRSGVRLLLAGEHDPVRRGLAAVGAPGIASDPWLTLTAALLHVNEPAFPAAAEKLQHARQTPVAHPQPGLDALRTSAERLGVGLGLIDGPPPDGPDPGTAGPELEALLRICRAAAEIVTDRRGIPDEPSSTDDTVRTDLERVVTLARTSDLGYLEVQGLSLLASLAATRGEYPAMVTRARAAVDTATRCGKHPSAWSASSTSVLAYADLLAGDPEAARSRAAESLASPEGLPPAARWSLRTVLATARGDQGERAAGWAEARAARAELGHTPAPPSLSAALTMLEHRSAVLLGNTAAAEDVTSWLEARLGPVGEVFLLRAWSEAAAGRHEAARAAVAPVRASEVPVLLPHTRLEVHLIDAEAALHADDRAAAHGALDAALAAGVALNVVRPLALAGARSREALMSRPAARGTGWFPSALAAALAVVHAEAAAPLSERELAVLTLLPSLLSTAEIAAELVVSVNTVKSHIRSIYAKLGASTRREAVLLAHARGLL